MSQKRVLVVKLGQIGDVIMSIPGVKALHDRGFSIDWVCGTAVAPLLACYSWIRVIPADDTAILGGRGLDRATALGKLWIRLAFKEYDLCITLYYDPLYRWLTSPVRASRKRMLVKGSRANSLLLSRHHTDEYARFLLEEQDTCRDQSRQLVSPDRLFPSSLAPPTGRRRIAIVPGGGKHLVREQAAGQLSGQILRRWPVERYQALAELIVAKDWEIVLLGSVEDRWARPYFAHLLVTDLMGQLALPEVVTFCNTCDAVICHDTGPMHLSGLSTACVVGIFGPTDPATRIPRRNGVVGIWGGQNFACRPCYDGSTFAPCASNGCMQQVTAEFVFEELERLLTARSRGQSGPWRVVTAP